MGDARRASGAALADALRDSRARTWALVDDLTPQQWQVPQRPGINPIAWELAHLAWFAEFWVLRGPHHRDASGFAQAARPPRHAGPDAILDSSRLPHDERWRTALPSRDDLVRMLAGQLDACCDVIPANDDDTALYFHRLALFHEDMHGEAFTWLRAALELPAPCSSIAPPHAPRTQALTVPGGRFALGRDADERGFAFDNEQAGHRVDLEAFEIDSAPLSNAAFLRFVDSGGYDDPAFWPGDAGCWRAQSRLRHPQRWRQDAAADWQMRWFDTWLLLDPDATLIHVNAYEAEAYCLWAKRRLPSAAEWAFAAARAPGLHWGHSVWEWSADAFEPYPGFAPGPYREYSEPWFGSHRELRGGAFATHERLHDRRYRNFFEPHRHDVFAGFRTAAR